MTKLRPSWFCCTVNTVGQCGDLCVAWNLDFFKLSPFVTCDGILLEGSLREDNRSISLLNSYGPCIDRKPYWDSVVSSGLLATKNLILARDLNFTVSTGEVWGSKAGLDPLTKFFKGNF